MGDFKNRKIGNSSISKLGFKATLSDSNALLSDTKWHQIIKTIKKRNSDISPPLYSTALCRCPGEWWTRTGWSSRDRSENQWVIKSSINGSIRPLSWWIYYIMIKASFFSTFSKNRTSKVSAPYFSLACSSVKPTVESSMGVNTWNFLFS